MNLLIKAVSPVDLTYSSEGLLTFEILSHTYRYKVTSWSHNLLISHTVFDSGSLAGILPCWKPVSPFCRGRDEGSPYSLRTADVFPVVASLSTFDLNFIHLLFFISFLGTED